MVDARIYRPDKTAMQSGKAGMDAWLLEFIPESPYFIDSLMGWSGMKDTTRELCLRFPTREAAIAYAKANNITYTLKLPHQRKYIKKSYADNFAYKKQA